MAEPSNATTTPTSSSSTTKSAMLVQLTTDGIPKLHCPVCDKALVSLNGYVNHVKKHEPPGGFLCRYCDERFCSEDALKKHRDEVHTAIICRLCKGVTFTSENDYREHIRYIHNGIDREMFKCDKCGAEYKSLYPFKRHVETECGTIKPYKCEVCEIRFVTKYNLKQHKELHTGERKFCCSYCGKNFKQKGRLVEHERSHTGEKPYKCDVCGKCFAHRESIVTHSSIHTGIRLVECKCCLTRFSCYSNLIKHRRTRPETCGLPQYDPPKQRIRRTQRLRIPATLNPTSEIKVSNSNRIIKPDHKNQKRKAVAKVNRDKRSKLTTRKGTETGEASYANKSRRKIKLSTSSTDEDDGSDDIWHCDDSDGKNYTEDLHKSEGEEQGEVVETTITIEPQTLKSNLKSVTKLENDALSYATDGSEEEDHPDLDPIESESEEDMKIAIEKIADIMAEKCANYGKDVDALACNNDLEFINSREFADTEIGVKSEEEESIFNYKDKLLDCLLNDDENKNSNTAIKTEQAGLHETEVILVKNEDDDINYVEEEDCFEIDKQSSPVIDSCKTMLLDGCERYPTLEENANVKATRNAAANPRPKKNPKSRGPRSKFSNEDEKASSMISNEGGNGEEFQAESKEYKEAHVKEQNTTGDDGDGEQKPKRARNPRKREKTDTANNNKRHSRMAKITQKELKERLKLSNRVLEKVWQCPYCIKLYHIRRPFAKHLREGHKRPEEEIKELFKKEEEIVKEGEVFKCHICGKIYLMEKRLTDHVKLHGPAGNLVFKCPCYCAIYFATKQEATQHARQEHRSLLYCNICEKFMTGHDSFKTHMRKHKQENDNENNAGSKRNLVCDKCGKKFSGRTSLTDHIRSDCGRKPIYECNVCGKNLTTAGILKTHLLLHKDDTPYQCDKCGKTFKVKAQYKTHIKTRHTDHKPFQCHLCPRAYPYRESLLTHMTVHTGIKRFLCNGCGKRFTCVSNLQAHRKVNSDTCGQLPLNAKATQYMGVQKGNLLIGAKPEAGVDYKETNTLLAKEVIDRDRPMAQEINYPSEPSEPLATVPLNCTRIAAQPLLLPQVINYVVDIKNAAGATPTTAYIN